MGTARQTRSFARRWVVASWALALGCPLDEPKPSGAGSETSTGGESESGSTTGVARPADSTGSSSADGTDSSTGQSESSTDDGGHVDPIPAVRVHLSGYSDIPPLGLALPSNGNDGFILGLTVAGIDTTVTATLLTTVSGPANDTIEDIARSPDGTIHAVGCTSNQLFATPGAYQGQLGSFSGAFAAAYAPDGSTLAATYLGSGLPTCIRHVDALEDGSIVVAASTGAGGLEGTPGSHQPTVAGLTELLGARLDGSLGTLTWASHLGGTDDEVLMAAALAPGGGWIVSARTQSLDFPTTGVPVGGGDPSSWYPILAQLSSDGSTLEWSTVLEFGNERDVEALAVLPDGDLLLCGHAQVEGSLNDAWVARVSPDASRLRASTTLGGSGDDRCKALGVDARGHVFGLAEIRSTDFPVTPGVIQGWTTERWDFPQDLALFKLDPGLERVVYSTVLGGDDDDWRGDPHLGITPEGDAFVSFDTRSTDLPVTDNAEIDHQLSPYGNGYLVRLSEDGTQRRFATYLGQWFPGFSTGLHLTGFTLTSLDAD